MDWHLLDFLGWISSLLNAIALKLLCSFRNRISTTDRARRIAPRRNVFLLGGEYCTIKTLSNKTFEILKNVSISTIYLDHWMVEKFMPFTFSNLRHPTALEVLSTFIDNLCLLHPSKINTGKGNTKILHFQLPLRCEFNNYIEIDYLSGLD